jgi:cellulose synthase (UDP-forming)
VISVITRRYQVERIKYPWRIKLRFRGASLFLLGLAVCIVTLALGWFTDFGGIADWFVTVNHTQRELEWWFQAPSSNAGWILSLVVLVTIQTVMYLSPQSKTWSRLLIIAVSLALVIRYVLWRSLTTLNLSTPTNGILSLGLFGLELLGISNYIFQLFFTIQKRERSHEADQLSVAVKTEKFLPTVDILIPTYNEPAAILRRSVIGCQALNYTRKQIYLLDDSNRAEIRQLAAELRCHYIARPYNRHAKAGNLNYAIARTSSDLITVFDADFIPTKDFLTRTVGFFQNRKIGLVQTHQAFYNPDPLACNLGIDQAVPHENETYARHYMPIRDGSNSTPCYGSSFVVRRDVLQTVGGFTTKSVSEDLYTSVRITAQGYQIVYLNESLSAGLVPEDIPSHVLQRQRWGRGSIQAFFLKENPLIIPGLNLRQRIAYMEGITQWLGCPTRVIFLLLPSAVTFLGIIPFSGQLSDWFYFFFPLYLTQMLTTSWLSNRATSLLAMEVYSITTCFPLAMTVLQTMVRPFSKGFQVTPKESVITKPIFRWKLAAPLIGVWLLTLCSLLWQIYRITTPSAYAANSIVGEYSKLGLFWNGYNLMFVGLAILSLIDIPKASLNFRLDRNYPIQLKIDDQAIHGRVKKISEIDAEVVILSSDLSDASLQRGSLITLEILNESLELKSRITRVHRNSSDLTLELSFEEMNLSQRRRLVELLFCQPGQWRPQKAPSELRMFWLLLRSVFYPRVLQKLET